MWSHPHGGQDTVQGENQIQGQNLDNGKAEIHHNSAFGVDFFFHIRVNGMVNFRGGLPDQEQSARNQYDVTPGKLFPKNSKYRVGQPDQHE